MAQLKVKRVNKITGFKEIINFGLAIAKIEDESLSYLSIDEQLELRKKLNEGIVLKTQRYRYSIVNPVTDFVNNIDDINLDEGVDK